MYRKVIIVVFATFVLAKANPAPKIESSLLDNLLQAEGTGRSEASLEETIKNYIKSQDLTLNLPVIGSVTLDSKKLDNDEIDLKLNWGGEVQGNRPVQVDNRVLFVR